MDFRYDDGVEAFRREVVAFLDAVMADARHHGDPRDLTGLDEAFERSIHRAVGERGWFDLPPERQAVFELEVARADAPLIDTATTLTGHVVAHYRPDLLPRWLAGEVQACVAYTEPVAGSDLGAIEAIARPEGDGWVLDGTKTLVTGAHKADWCCTIARTRLDVPPRQGMSMFLVDMRSPGVEVSRRPTMNGWTLADVHFHGVRLGPDALLGERDRGWSQLATALAGERSGMFWLGFAHHVLDLLVEYVRAHAPDDPVALDTLGRSAVGVAAAERLCRRALWASMQGHGDGALPSMVKVVLTELLQELAQASTELAGAAGLVWAPLFAGSPPGAAAGGRFAWEYLERVHATIGAGANEVHRDAVAQLGLGFPRGR